MTNFNPQPFHVVDTPEQLKAFTDPLRIRLLIALGERAATNQQLADSLGEPQANVLYHLRALLKVGLIRLVATQVKGGNVEKYYRAVARTFDLRIPAELRPAVASAEFGVLSQAVAASAAAWPETPPQFVIRGRRVSLAEATVFYERLFAFIAGYWSDPYREGDVGPPDAEADAPLFYCAAVVYRGPEDTRPPADPPP